jgi:hypothetical protein
MQTNNGTALGIMVVITIMLLSFENGAQAPSLFGRHLRCLLANHIRRSRERSRESKYPLIVYPTRPTRAILWLLGRPWDTWQEPSNWPTGYVFQGPLDSNGSPLSISGEARKNISAQSWARLQCWHARSQLSIICRETRRRLLGMRGTSRQCPKTWRRSEVDESELLASSSDGLPTTQEATQSLQVSVSCETRMMPNAKLTDGATK